MKKMSFKLAALLVVILATVSAFKTTGSRSLPITGWYEVYDNILAPNVPAYALGPLTDPLFNPLQFQPGAIDIDNLDCGSTYSKVCAAYFRASTELNIQSPPDDGMLYFLPGGRP